MPTRRLTFTLAAAVEDRLAAELWQLGTLGFESRDGEPGELRVVAYFPEPAPPALAAVEWGALGVELVESIEQPERDWLAVYRRTALPVAVGTRLIVDPRDDAEPPPADSPRRRLHLPARRAFGTGSHATTRLAVELLEAIPLAGRSLLDLGAGSGILSFAAVVFGAARVVAVEADPVAALAAGENRARNGLAPHLVAATLASLVRRPLFDAAVANILWHRLEPELPELAARLRRGAELVVSGCPDEAGPALVTALEGLGLAVVERRAADGWFAARARREAA